MTIHIVEETAHMLAQGVIKDQGSVSLRTAYRLSLLEQIREPTVIDAVLEPRRFREEAREVGCIGAVQHAAGDVGQAFVVEDHQPRQVLLEMTKLAPILKEIAKDVRMGSHDGSRGYNGKLHEAFALSS